MGRGARGGKGSKWGSFQRGTLNITFNVLTYLGAALRHKEGWGGRGKEKTKNAKIKLLEFEVWRYRCQITAAFTK